MKCQAQVERIKSRLNLRPVIITTEYGPCTYNAVATVGKLHLCTVHVRLALSGLIDEAGTVAERGALRDVRKYPKKFPRGLFQWAEGLEPIALEPAPMPDVTFATYPRSES